MFSPEPAIGTRVELITLSLLSKVTVTCSGQSKTLRPESRIEINPVKISSVEVRILLWIISAS